MLRRGRSRVLLFLGLLSLALPSLACDLAFQHARASASDEWRKTYTLAEGGQFELINVNGTVDISSSADATSVEVVAERKVRASSEEAAREELKKIEIRELAGPDSVRIEVPRFRGGTFNFGSREVNFKVKVPKNARVRVSNTNGEVHAAGLSGGIRIRTTNGEIVGKGLAGAVDGGTTNGGINLQVMEVPPEGIRLETTNGGIELTVPADTKATIAARWLNGGFSATGLKPEGETERRRYDGKLNGGGPRIELSTTNGGIRIAAAEHSR